MIQVELRKVGALLLLEEAVSGWPSHCHAVGLSSVLTGCPSAGPRPPLRAGSPISPRPEHSPAPPPQLRLPGPPAAGRSPVRRPHVKGQVFLESGPHIPHSTSFPLALTPALAAIHKATLLPFLTFFSTHLLLYVSFYLKCILCR